MKIFHTWGCSIYALHNTLQAGSQIQKWNSRARLGINLGLSPKHARSISLVLNIKTGNVSPQFHVVHDDFLETVQIETDKTVSRWQYKSGLVGEDESSQVVPQMPNFEDSFTRNSGSEETTSE